MSDEMVRDPKAYLSFVIGHLSSSICHLSYWRSHEGARVPSERFLPMTNDKCQIVLWLLRPKHYSITASRSPPLTVAPTSALIVTTVPLFGDFISFCIFIASTTAMPAPASTV